MTARLRVLVVEDDPVFQKLVRVGLETLDDPPCDVRTAASLKDAVHRLASEKYDALFTDLGLPDSRGLDTVRLLHEAAPDVAIVVLTGTEREQEAALKAVQSGAQYYLVKGQVTAAVLGRALRYARERKSISLGNG